MFHIVRITDGLVSQLSHLRIVRITDGLIIPLTCVSHGKYYGLAGKLIIPLTYIENYGRA